MILIDSDGHFLRDSVYVCVCVCADLYVSALGTESYDSA